MTGGWERSGPGTTRTTIEQARHILHRLVENNPIDTSQEGLDDGCHWCDTTQKDHPARPYKSTWVHEVTCPWVEARRFLDLDLTVDGGRFDLHEVKETS